MVQLKCADKSVVFTMLLLFFIAANAVAELAIQLVSPENSSVHPVCATLMLQANVTATSGETIKDVAFYRSSNRVIRRLRTEPWEYKWENVKSGFYPIYAKVRTEDGLEAVSDTVYVVVGNVQKGDVIINGGFDCDNKISPWTTSSHGTASFSMNVYDDFYFDDATYLVAEIDDGSDTDWHIQLTQNTGLDSGHVYQIYFYADADEPKTIAINWQENGDDWTVHWQQGDILIEGADYYGPYEFACTVTDPTADFKFIIGGNAIDIFLDSVSILDLNATDVQDQADPVLLSDFKLYPAFPNPFNGQTMIRYALARPGEVQLDVINMAGQKVRTLVSGSQSQGVHSFAWDGLDENGQHVSTGVYIYRLSTVIDGTRQHQSRKIVLLK